MDELIAFLNARLNEDEAAAKAASREAGAACWELRPEDGYEEFPSKIGPAGASYPFPFHLVCDPETGAHAARHDPARVLREVEAKREIVAAHHPETPSKYGHDVLRCAVCQTERGVWAEDRHADPWPCLTLRALAAVRSDHPDYRAEWHPDR